MLGVGDGGDWPQKKSMGMPMLREEQMIEGEDVPTEPLRSSR